MIRSEKKLKELSLVLNKNNNLLISEAIGLLRDDQPFEGAIGLLTSFYDKTDDSSLRKAIEGFMDDLKDQSVRKEVIDEIRKEWKDFTISMLVSSCWQSGLDYSDYSLDLAKIFLRGDYVTAVECLTVIEESADNISREKKDEIIQILKVDSPLQISEKSALTNELISILTL